MHTCVYAQIRKGDYDLPFPPALDQDTPCRYFKDMVKKYLPGDIVYIVENASRVREAVVVRSSGGFCLLRLSGGGGTRLRETRLFRTVEEAEEFIRRIREANREVPEPDDSDRNTGDFGWLG